MQRSLFIFAYFFVCVNCFAQQYPFVHYTPKDGLISNQIKNIYQDSKGRLYFTSVNGLSVYDGARFINYNSKNGLETDIVNCVMEMSIDSVWIVTNDSRIYCLKNGKLKSLTFQENPPIIDNLIRDEKGNLYAASEYGIYLFQQNKFIKLPFSDIKGKNLSRFIGNILPAGKHLLVVRDNSMLNTEEKYILYLYDIASGKIIDQTKDRIIYATSKAPDGRIWISTDKNILALDTDELRKGKIILKELPPPYDKIITTGLSFISFDQYGNCWISDKVSVLKKISTDGHEIFFSPTSGLSTMDIYNVFLDKEGTAWISTFSGGVDKLVNSNFSFLDNVFEISAINSISYSADKNQLLLYSPTQAKAIAIEENGKFQTFHVKDANKITQLFETPKGRIGITEKAIYKMTTSGNNLYPNLIFTDSIDNIFDNPLVDKNGNFLLRGKDYLTVIINEGIIYRKKINSFVDNAGLDSHGNIWVATRAGELIMYQPNPNDPVHYLENEVIVSKKLPDISPRSIVLDKKDNIWIGSRNDGISVYQLKNGNINKLFTLNLASGLSDNFITQLTCDSSNNIWACSPSGLDKISVRNELPIIENLTKQNNIYQKVLKIVIDKNNIAWGMASNGFIKITPENKKSADYTPSLMVSMIKSGKDTVTNTASLLPHNQNNLSFYFGATSFLDEKQVLYSYQLQGGSNDQWSEPSNNTTVTFIDLHPGDYILNVKASFPAGRYPEQMIHYKFSIAPPWWQTWWFRAIVVLFIIGLLIISFRFYYNRRLERRMAVLEKQQAIEKERTRIATDMHDDLGAGLSRIKFLTQSVLNKKIKDEVITTELEKITLFSDEMSEKMGEIIWALNEKNDTLADLIAYTRSYTMEYLANHNIKCDADTPLHLPANFITGEIRRNIFLSVKECLHNIVKHAQATKVFFSVELNGKVQIIIHDDGKGIDWDNQRAFSNGIENLKKRMKDVNGSVSFLNDKGTKVTLTLPLIL